MDHKSEYAEKIVQLARFALTGRLQDVQMYVRRLGRKVMKDDPELARRLIELLAESPTRESPLRNVSMETIPVDHDSRLQLLRHEYPVEIDVEPIWDISVENSVKQVVKERQNENALYEAGLNPTRSILFTGAPGLGKTLSAHWLARELDKPLLTLDLSAVMSSFLGRSGTNVRAVLDYAKGVRCVLLLDEFDAIAKKRDDATEIGELKRLVTVLMQEIDDWPPSGLLVAATNHPNLLDPAVWRRFDLRIDFEMPNSEQIKDAVRRFLRTNCEGLNPWVEIATILFRGTSFSEIETEVNRLRKESIISRASVENLFEDLVRRRIKTLASKERFQAALRLTDLGLSQRVVSDLTGVSRDTIRKANRARRMT